MIRFSVAINKMIMVFHKHTNVAIWTSEAFYLETKKNSKKS